VPQVSSVNERECIIEIRTSVERIKVPKEKVEALKGVVGAKAIARMKKECVECPQTKATRSFIECFTCGNFLRRLKGQVHCSIKQT
jgi:hypothetical protein